MGYAKSISCCWFVYNQTLAYQKETYEKGKNLLAEQTAIITATEN